MTPFSILVQKARFTPASLAKEFSVDRLEVLAWLAGEQDAPTNVVQSLTVIADFSNQDVASDNRTKSRMVDARPTDGYRVLSFFTGGGGLDLGFEAAGFKTVYATDIDDDSCKTLRQNKGTFLSEGLEVECVDISQLVIENLPQDIDVIIGGPPCQSFSASGRRAGGASGRLDGRGNLFQAYCRIIAAVQPKVFVFENVRGILATNKGEDWKSIVQTFANLGYKLSYRLLDALDYGAPQQRERMFLVGHRLSSEFLFPEPTHGPDSASGLPHVTSGQALAQINEDENLAGLELSSGKYSYLLPLVPPGQNYLVSDRKLS